MTDYHSSEQSKFIVYLDANNLYGGGNESVFTLWWI